MTTALKLSAAFAAALTLSACGTFNPPPSDAGNPRISENNYGPPPGASGAIPGRYGAGTFGSGNCAVPQQIIHVHYDFRGQVIRKFTPGADVEQPRVMMVRCGTQPPSFTRCFQEMIGGPSTIEPRTGRYSGSVATNVGVVSTPCGPEQPINALR